MPPPLYAALIDVPSGALLTLSLEPPIIAFLVKNTADVRPYWSVNYPNYMQSFALGNANPAVLPEWTWSALTRTFVPTPKALLSDRLRAASALAVKKSYALYEMMQSLAIARNSLATGVLLQESVYLTKKAQALRYQADGYPEEDLLRYPYVLQYAEIADLPMRDAALEILFKSSLDDEVLAKTEALRLKFFGRLKTVELDGIDAMMVEFRGAIR
jgi:hypothetical protein